MGNAREVLDRMTEAATKGRDPQMVASFYTDDAVLTAPEGEARGHDQIADYWRNYFDAFADVTYEPISQIEAGNKAVDEGYIIGTNTGPLHMPSGETVQPTGKRLRLRECDVATVDNGKIREHHMYYDELEFMQQLGLSN